jgi:hypothetical protein
MVTNQLLEEVWCETHDDITLLWHGEKEQEVEFVQVKNLSLNALWSVAKLCKREKTNENPQGIGSSILEKSFAHDRCIEPCKFRIVTSLPTNDLLKVLTLPLNSPNRDLKDENFGRLIKEVKDKVNGLTSPNGHDVIYWLTNSMWQIMSQDDVIIRNVANLFKIISSKSIYLTGETIEGNIYPQILIKAQDAASAPWERNDKAKKIQREEFHNWLDNILREAQYPLKGSAGEKLRDKMERANIANDYILTAQEQRRQFMQERLHPKYLELSDLDLIEGEVLSELKSLRLGLDNGEFVEGAPFLKVCQDKLRELQNTLQVESKPPMFYLDGCMYEITDRCAHRFTKV